MAIDDQCIVVKYLAVTESNFTKRFQSGEYLTQYISVLYLGVQNIFDTLKMGVKVRVLGISSFTKETEQSFIEQSAIPGAEKYLNLYDLLSNMADYYCDQSTGLAKDADIIMLSVRQVLYYQ
ncbi:venom metalloproteinase antarease-like TpachMP_A [Centruroides vittatus]|uniref:venom metalloproteinase antarease-like TpachMP_A n=1 Tax=Centruroides vittatus TaxID=120091 RepID=UPI00350EAF24